MTINQYANVLEDVIKSLVKNNCSFNDFRQIGIDVHDFYDQHASFRK